MRRSITTGRDGPRRSAWKVSVHGVSIFTTGCATGQLASTPPSAGSDAAERNTTKTLSYPASRRGTLQPVAVISKAGSVRTEPSMAFHASGCMPFTRNSGVTSTVSSLWFDTK